MPNGSGSTGRRDLALGVLRLLADGEWRTGTEVALAIHARRVDVVQTLRELERLSALVSVYGGGGRDKSALTFSIASRCRPSRGTTLADGGGDS